MFSMRSLLPWLLAACAAGGCAGPAFAASAPACPVPKSMSFTIDRMFRRDVLGFTEGFEVHGRDIYESTGDIFGNTRLMRMDRNGHVTVIADFGTRFFGEGLTILHDQIYQMSWKEHIVSVYDLKGQLLRTMRNDREGWGLTHDGDRLIASDGSSRLFFIDPKNFATLGSVQVREGSDPVEQINELEWVDGKVYANIFETREIVRINPADGCVEAVARMDNLWDRMSAADRSQTAEDGNFVLNGIAWDPVEKLFYLTGKQWPVVFSGRFSGP
jgi:glutamine cyclotransferase